MMNDNSAEKIGFKSLLKELEDREYAGCKMPEPTPKALLGMARIVGDGTIKSVLTGGWKTEEFVVDCLYLFPGTDKAKEIVRAVFGDAVDVSRFSGADLLEVVTDFFYAVSLRSGLAERLLTSPIAHLL